MVRRIQLGSGMKNQSGNVATKFKGAKRPGNCRTGKCRGGK